jgi:hypothetical protein
MRQQFLFLLQVAEQGVILSFQHIFEIVTGVVMALFTIIWRSMNKRLNSLEETARSNRGLIEDILIKMPTEYVTKTDLKGMEDRITNQFKDLKQDIVDLRNQ